MPGLYCENFLVHGNSWIGLFFMWTNIPWDSLYIKIWYLLLHCLAPYVVVLCLHRMGIKWYQCKTVWAMAEEWTKAIFKTSVALIVSCNSTMLINVINLCLLLNKTEGLVYFLGCRHDGSHLEASDAATSLVIYSLSSIIRSSK